MLLALSMAHAAPPECPFGVNAHQASDAALDLAAAAGVGWVRFDFNWFQFEPQRDVYDWSVPDRFVDHATALGLNVYPSIGYTPTWAAGSWCDDASANPDDHCMTRLPAETAQWEEFVRLAVERYGDRVKYWGVWNEPNLSQFFSGSREEWVAQILIPAADVIHAECADCAVVGPELANLRGAHWDADEGVCAFGECSFNGWDYSLRQILTDAGGSFDVISHHKYTDPAEAWWDQVLYGESLLGVQYIHGVREITDDLAPGKPVWITELGWETTPFGDHDPAYAAAQLTALYGALPAIQDGTWAASPTPWPELQKLFWYDLHDDPNGASWGLLDADLAPKEPYDAYTQVIADLGGCEAFVGGTTSTGTTPTDTGTPTTSTTGTTPTGTDPTTTPSTTTGGSGTANDAPTESEGGGCGCASGPASGGAVVAVGLALVLRRRHAVQGPRKVQPTTSE